MQRLGLGVRPRVRGVDAGHVREEAQGISFELNRREGRQAVLKATYGRKPPNFRPFSHALA